MKFYEVHYPYYALLKANDKEEAIKMYVEYVGDDDGTLREEFKEVEHDYALVMYTWSMTKEMDRIPIDSILNDFQSDEAMVLLIDSSLL